MSNIRWQTNETGILRKKDERCEDLFVFGYSCKIFNDYDKALFIDQGKHLIPWMGDDTLKIDRYVFTIYKILLHQNSFDYGMLIF